MTKNEKNCREILKFLNNAHTKIENKEDFKGNYYVFPKDTIYLSTKHEYKTEEEKMIVLCHECKHSIQDRKTHIINMVLSNIEIIMSIVLFVFILTKIDCIKITTIIYLLIFAVMVGIRIVLEADAIKGSFEICKKLIKNGKFNLDTVTLEKMKRKTKKLLPVFYLSIFSKKMIKLMILGIIYYIKTK